MELLKRLEKYRLPKYVTNTTVNYDYQKALGIKRYEEIRAIVEQEVWRHYEMLSEELYSSEGGIVEDE
jgi:hypothetical protein